MRSITFLTFLSVFLSLSNAHAQKFAIVGDYGVDNSRELRVSELVKSWNPDFVITVGDNNYPSGSAATIDQNVGKYYSEFIFPYKGTYGDGASENRFFPSIGNHDARTENGAPYYDYFELPGNERYYDFIRGDVHFFALNSNASEPDGIIANSRQGFWLRDKLARSTSKFNIVYFHHSPYTSGYHSPTTALRWPFAEWGADAVVYGHDHNYERLEVNGIPFFANGLGGATLRPFTKDPLPYTKMRYAEQYGAMLVEVRDGKIYYQFQSIDGDIIETYTPGQATDPQPEPDEDTSELRFAITNGRNDVEENESNGSVYVISSDIELGFDSYNNQNFQTVGLRYENVSIPRSAKVKNAYLEFTVDETGSDPAEVLIYGEATGNSSAFDASSPYSVSDRFKTRARTTWAPDIWNSTGAIKKSPELAPLIQEIIDRSDWRAGNSLGLFIKGTLGTRTAESYEGGGSTSSIKLIVELDEETEDDQPDDSASNAIGRITLYNFATDTDLATLTDGTTLNPADYTNFDQLAIRVRPASGDVASISFFVNGNKNATENLAPYNTQGSLNLREGANTLRFVPYSGSNESGTRGEEKSITVNLESGGETGEPDTPSNDFIGEITLFDFATKTDLLTLENNSNIDISDYTGFDQLVIKAAPASDQVKSIAFEINGQRHVIESFAPFNTQGNLGELLREGTNTLTFVPYAQQYGRGRLASEKTIVINFTNGSAGKVVNATGRIITDSANEAPLDIPVVFPNPPKSNTLNVLLPNTLNQGTVQYSFVDGAGSLIDQGGIKTDGSSRTLTLVIDGLETLAPGVYYLNLTGSGNEKYHLRVIK